MVGRKLRAEQPFRLAVGYSLHTFTGSWGQTRTQGLSLNTKTALLQSHCQSIFLRLVGTAESRLAELERAGEQDSGSCVESAASAVEGTSLESKEGLRHQELHDLLGSSPAKKNLETHVFTKLRLSSRKDLGFEPSSALQH